MFSKTIDVIGEFMSKSLKITVLYGVVLFLDMLEMTIFNLGTPSIAAGLQVPLADVNTLITVFFWAATLCIPLAGWLGDSIGHKRVFIAGQLLFAVLSIGCATAQSISELVLYRAIQGCATGLILPIGLSFLARGLSAQERALAMVKVSLILRLAPAIGPILVGYTLVGLGWRWLFLIKLPMVLGGALASFIWLERDGPVVRRRFDWKGLFLSSLSLTCLLMGLAVFGKGGGLSEGLFWLVGSAVAIFTFVKVESKAEHPIVPLPLFQSVTFCQGNIIQAIAYAIVLGLGYLCALYLQDALGFSVVDAGWIISASTIGMVGAIPLISYLCTRVKAISLLFSGFGLLLLAVVALSLIKSDTSILVAAALMVLVGLGGSLVLNTNMGLVFSDISKEMMGSASGVFTLVRQVSYSVGIALMGSVIPTGYSVAWLVLIGCIILGLFCVLFIHWSNQSEFSPAIHH